MDNYKYDEKKLIEMARDTMEHAYSPYSKVKVGAALVTRDGNFYTGCNVENSSYGLTICAERVAVGCAVKSGETDFTAIAIVNSSEKAFPPCGACRQVLSEFSPDMDLIVVANDGEINMYKLSEFFPTPFKMGD